MSRNVLIVSPFLPWPADFGGAQRVFHLADELAKAGDVTLVAPASGDEFEAAREISDRFDLTLVPAKRTARQAAGVAKRVDQIIAMARGEASIKRSIPVDATRAAIARLLRIKQIDLIQVEFPQMMLALPDRRPPVVLDAHNIEHQLVRRVAETASDGGHELFNRIEWRRLRRLERQVWSAADLTIATSKEDAAVITQVTGHEVPVIPNGVDLERFDGIQPVRDSHEIVFVAAMRHQPNADGAIWLAREVLPIVQRELPDARLTLVGVDPPPSVLALRGPSIVVTGRVDDVRPYLERAGAVAVPLFAGGGTRLKILEALAARRPVVSTSIGAEGLDMEDGKEIILADDPDQFAAALLRILDDRRLALHLAAAGCSLVEERYGWPTIARRLLQSHDQLRPKLK